MNRVASGSILHLFAYPALLLGLILLAPPAEAQNTSVNEGGDLAFGGAGAEPGKFQELRDLTLDAHGNVYTLDGANYDGKTGKRSGNLRVQKFSSHGKLLAVLDLRDEATGETLGSKNDPQRLAVDARGQVYVTQPAAGRVQQFGTDGKLVRSIEVPSALAITTYGQGDAERIAVVPSRRAVAKGKWTWQGGDRILILADKGTIERTIRLQLERPLEQVRDVTADRQGNFYLQAEPNAIYKFSPAGKRLKTFGGNPTTRGEDGSEVLHTVAVDSRGNVYTFTWGNPGLVTRFDADGRTVTQRGGQFQWADPWSVHSRYTPLAVGPDDRLWVAATSVQNPAGPHFRKQRAVPAVVRLKADFFENPAGAIKRGPVRSLGYRPQLTCGLPYNVAYAPGKPVPMEYVVLPANRNVSEVVVAWQVFDAHKHEVAHGEFRLALRNGQEARERFMFTPPRFGAYFVLARARSEEGSLGALGEHVGVTPRWPGLPELKAGESKSGWEDALRQMWTGLPNMRLHPAKSLDKFDEDLRTAEKYGATVVVQLVDSQKKFKADDVRTLMERFKGRIKYVEVCNEPNFSGRVEDYFKIHKQAYDIIKGIDPRVKVMGPATVNMDLGWLRRLYALGFKNVCDIVSLHDYEGHESISPEHWRWKFGDVRKILAAHGDAAKSLWQTERAIAGVRGQNFQGLVQAIRTTLHRDLLETLGVPGAHNNHYYLNQAGYSSVPSYLWSKNGPHPAALALRTRQALTGAAGRVYAGKLDFGPNGNALFLAVRYAGPDGETVSLRNLGTRDTPLAFAVKGADALEVVDAWGNTSRLAVADGKAQITLKQLPTYVRLPRAARLAAPALDFGHNLATAARFTYSEKFQGDLSLLNNGILETYHAGNPNGDTNGKKIWQGEMSSKSVEKPPTLEIVLERPQQIDRVVVRGIRADNAFCALLAYDLQYQQGTEWKTIERLDRPMPSSEEVRTADAVGALWMDDTSFFIHRFTPVRTARLRLVVRDVSHGLVPDTRARTWGNIIPQKLMLREVEVYGPGGK